MSERDLSLEVLLDLDGYGFTFEPSGYSVKFKVKKVPATPERPHGKGHGSLGSITPIPYALRGVQAAPGGNWITGTAGLRRALIVIRMHSS